jgi:hypothetical protein
MKQAGKIKSSNKEQKSEKIFILSFLLMLGIVWTHSRFPIFENVPSYFSKLFLFNEIGQDAVAPFFLYATHYLPIHVLQRYIIFNMESILGCWIAYLLVPVFVVVTSVSIAYILDEKAHQLYNLLSGGR